METTVDVRQVEGLALAARTGSGHWITMDTKEEFGGTDGAATPMELLLAGLCGCTAMDTISILDKMREPYRQLRVSATAKKSEDYPKKFTEIKLHFTILANRGEAVSEKNVKKAMDLSIEKYCSVYASLSKDIKLTRDHEIVGE